MDPKFKTVTNIHTGETTDSNVVNAKEIGVIKMLVTKNDIVLDIGANVGFMTKVLAERARHVYAFEPSPYNFKQLQENTKHLDNITLYPIALSDTIGYETLHICPKDPGMNRLYPSKWCEGGEQIEVATSTIDIIFLAGSHFPDRINFVKVDVEGLEYRVLFGMMNILIRDHPTILLEFHPPSILDASCNPKDLYNLLRNELGYNDPILIGRENNEVMTSYDQLFEITNNCPALNVLWKYN